MKLSKEKLRYFQERLEKEKNDLIEDLEKVGKRNPDAPGDWEVKAEDLNVETADKNELADSFEELQGRVAMEGRLEDRLLFAEQAIERIKDGTYGFCQICKKSIEEKRLEAYPAARHCIEHAKKNIEI